MKIRAATPEDLAQVGVVWNAMIRDTTATFTTEEKSQSALHQMLQARADAFLVAENRAGFAGFVTWGAFRAGPGYAQTVEHSIIAAQQGQGAGRALMQAACAQASAQGIHTMIACIGSENPAAVAFHTRLGFALAGRLPQVGRKAGRWHDLILMSKTLGTG